MNINASTSNSASSSYFCADDTEKKRALDAYEPSEKGKGLKKQRRVSDKTADVARTVISDQAAYFQTYGTLHGGSDQDFNLDVSDDGKFSPESPIDEANVGLFVKYGLEGRSEKIISDSFQFLREKTGFDYSHADFQSIDISIEPDFREDEERLSLLLSLLSLLLKKPSRFEIRIHLNLEASNFDLITKIVDKHPLLVHALSVTSDRISKKNREYLDKLLTKIKNLSVLCIKSKQLSENAPFVQQINHLSKLKELRFIDCYTLQGLPVLNNLKELTKLIFKNCHRMTVPPDLSNLINLKVVVFKNCFMMTLKPLLGNLRNLETLKFINCPLKSAPDDVGQLRSLKVLKFIQCPSLTPPDISELTKLETIDFRGCKFDEARSIEMCHRVIEKNPSLLFRLKLLNYLKIDNTSSIQHKLLECDLELFLENLDRFQNPDEQSYLNAIAKLSDEQASRHLLKLILRIQSSGHLELLHPKHICKFKEVQTLVTNYGLEDNPSSIISLYIFHKLVEVRDHRNFDTYFSDWGLFGAQLDPLRDHPRLKSFLSTHAGFFLENKTFASIKEMLFPPSERGNSCLYPLTVTLNNSSIKIECGFFASTERTSEILQLFGSCIENSTRTNSLSVKYTNNIAMDYNGLSRQFIGDFFQAVVSNKARIRFYEVDSGMHLKLPTTGAVLTSEIVEEFENLGKIFGFLLRSSTSYPVGELFHPSIFKILLGFSAEDLKKSVEEYRNMLLAMDQKKCFKLCRKLFDEGHLKKMLLLRKILSAENYVMLTTTQIRKINKFLDGDETVDADNYERHRNDLFLKTQEALNLSLVQKLLQTEIIEDFDDLAKDDQIDFTRNCGVLSIDFCGRSEIPLTIDTPEIVSSDQSAASEIPPLLNFERARREYIQEILTKYINTLVAIHAIARGVTASFPSLVKLNIGDFLMETKITNLQQLNNIGARHIRLKIEGKFTKENFKNSLIAEVTHGGSAAHVVAWIKEWVDDPTTTELKIRGVLSFITGSPGLSTGTKITIKLHNVPAGTADNSLALTNKINEVPFIAHTCTNRLEVPVTIGYEELKVWLNSCVTNFEKYELK
jgi:hypothetical protein